MVTKIKQTSPLEMPASTNPAEFAALEQAHGRQRVNELETVSQVSLAISTIRDQDELLRTVCDLTKERFDLYHVHIYLYDQATGQLALAAGAGEAGRTMRASGHRIKMMAPRSLVARAARSQQGVLVNDVTIEADYLPNPMLPDTRSELAVPLVLNEKLIGTLDVQSSEADRFDQDDLRVLSILASQIAVAVENARSFNQVTLLLENQKAEQERRDLISRIGVELLAAQDDVDLVKAISLVDMNPSVQYLMFYLDLNQENNGLVTLPAMRMNDKYKAGGGQAGPYHLNDYPMARSWDLNATALVFIKDVNANPDITPAQRQIYAGINARSSVRIPLKTGSTWQGFLVVFWPQPRSFSDVEKELFTALQQPLASAVQSRRSFLRVQAAEKQSAQLYKLSKQLNESFTELDLVTAIAENLPATPTAGVVFLEWDNSDHSKALGFTIRGFWRTPGNAINLPNTWSRDSFPNFNDADPTKLIWSDDMLADPRISEAEGHTYTALNTRSRVVLPLLRNGIWFGNVTAYWSEVHHHTEEELNWWRAAADQISLAFSRISLERQSTERSQSLETMAEVSAAITSIRQLDELLQQVSDLTKSQFNLYHAHIYLLDMAGQRLELAAGAGELGEIMRASGHAIALNAVRSLVARAARTGQLVLVNDTIHEPGFLPNPLLPESRSELSVPLIIGDRILGVLDVQSSQGGAFNENIAQVFSTLAAQIAIAIENARAFERSQALVDYNRTIVNSIPDGLMITDPVTGEIYQHNEQFLKMLGYTSSELQRANFFALTPPDWMDATRAALARSQDMHSTTAYEKEFFRRDNSRIPIRVSFGYFTDPFTRKQRAVSIISDLTEQRAEQRRREVIGQISAGLLNTQDDMDILKAFALVTPDPSASLSLSYFGEMPDGRFSPYSPVASRVAGIYTNANAVISESGVEHLVSFLQRMPNQPVFIEDIRQVLQTEPNVNNIVVSLQAVLASAVVIPLRTADQWLGSVIITWSEPHGFSAEEKDLINSATPLLITAVAARRAQIAEQSAEQESLQLYALNTAINTAKNEQEVLETIRAYAAPRQIDRAQIIVWRNDERGAISTLEYVADQPGVGQSDLTGVVQLVEDFPIVERLNRHDITWVENIHQDDVFDAVTRTKLEAQGIATCAFIPITIEGVPSGVVALYSTARFAPTPRQFRVFDAVRQQASTVLERLSLQRRTAQRVLELQTVAQVTTASATILDSERLLQTVVELTKEQFKLYHAHIYLLDDEARYLIMTAGAGQAGKMMKDAGHRIPVSRERSLVSQAARSRKGVVADDVTREANHMPNPLLPNTHSEVAVPLIMADKLIGVLDVQSDQLARFTPEDVFIFTTLADQIAVAVQNARLYEEQAHTAQQLREVDQLKSEFLASMSHELRTPLNSIIGFSEILADGLDGELPEEALGDIDTIHTSGQHLLELINDVLDLAKIEAGHMDLDQRPVLLSELVDEVIRTSRILIKDKPVELVADLSEHLPMLMADEKRLRQILKNLISNAIKFTQQGKIQVFAHLSADHSQVQISVKDSGVGISPDNQKMIFERFRQVDNSLTRQVGGTGLGLPISRQLIEMHGGQIWLNSAVGQGSTFSFTIPTAPESVEAVS